MLIKKEAKETYIRSNLKGGIGDIKILEHAPRGSMLNCRLFCEQEIPVGCSIGMHRHVNEIEIYVVRSGMGQVEEISRKYEVGEGDVILTRHDESHSIKNIGEESLIVTALILTHSSGDR